MSSDLFSSSHLTDFWPSEGRDYIENVNATIRFIMYTSVVIFLISGDPRAIYLGLIIGSFLVYTSEKKGHPYFEPKNEDYQDPYVHHEPEPPRTDQMNPYPTPPITTTQTRPSPFDPNDPNFQIPALAKRAQDTYQDRQRFPQVRAQWDPSSLMKSFGTGMRGTNTPTNILRGPGLPRANP